MEALLTEPGYAPGSGRAPGRLQDQIVRFQAGQTISDVFFPPQPGDAFLCFLCQGLSVETTTQFSIRKSEDNQVLRNSEEFPNRLWPELFRDVLKHIDGNDAPE